MESSENPRMPLTGRGVIYLFVLVGSAIATAYLVIRGLGILDDDVQYAVTIGLIVFYIGTFFCRDSVWIGIGKRALSSFILAGIAFMLLVLNGLLFEYFFGL